MTISTTITTQKGRAAQNWRSALQDVGLQGFLMTISPATFLLPLLPSLEGVSKLWSWVIASLAAVCLIAAAALIIRRRMLGQGFILIGMIFGWGWAFSYLLANPFRALSGGIVFFVILFALWDYRVALDYSQQSNHAQRSRQRARASGLALLLLTILVFGASLTLSSHVRIVILSSVFIQQLFLLIWLKSSYHNIKPFFASVLLLVLLLLIGFLGYFKDGYALWAFSSALVSLVFTYASKRKISNRLRWYELFANNPARLLISTFIILCLTGTLLLSLPIARHSDSMSLVDAIFTSVSAVCVTGLIVLDTPNFFTLYGQVFIIILIQLGGLGIMSITTLSLHALGYRLSLKHEKVLTSMTQTDHKNLIQSLGLILKVTFIAELIGSILLSYLFFQSGDSLGQAIWRGLFTAISAFCNAGFALQSDSLIAYQTQPVLLIVVSLLIIIGGLAPAAVLLVPNWLRRKTIPLSIHLSLQTSLVLLIAGTVFFFVFEYNGLLKNISIVDKIANAWFQSATLRTAGFNTVDFYGLHSSTYVIMLLFMFIGGSPGGTAGGIKTTTVSVLLLTFWTKIVNRDQVVFKYKLIPHSTVYKAIAVIFAGFLLWLAILIMLLNTQQIAAKDILFEVTSAFGTVGLSTGATSLLDPIGKVIIVIAMFLGRIGPITLFMFLSDDSPTKEVEYPETNISLT